MNHQPHFPLLLSSTFLLLHLIPTTAYYYYATTATTNTNTNFIRTSCSTTLYPDLCYTSLSSYANAIQQDPALLARVAIGVSLSKTKHMASYLSKLSSQAEYGSQPPRVTSALHDCFNVFDDAVDQIRGSLKQMRRLRGYGESLRFQVSNVQTWMSSALTNADTCTDGFQDLPEGPMKFDVCDGVLKVEEVTSNALALVNSYAAKATNP